MARDDIFFTPGLPKLSDLLAIYGARRSAFAERRAVQSAHAGGAGHERRHLLHHPRRRRAAASSVRLVQRRRGAGAERGRRSRRHRHQADALSHRAGLGGGRGAGARGREREAGHGRRGGAGALRRGAQHRLGAAARGVGRAGGVRPGGHQDAREGAAGHPPRRRRAAPLRPPLHRQLQREDGAALHGSRSAHLRSRLRRRRGAADEPHHRLQHGHGAGSVRARSGALALEEADRRADRLSRLDAAHDRARNAPCARRPAGADHRQDELARGAARDRGAATAPPRPA